MKNLLFIFVLILISSCEKSLDLPIIEVKKEVNQKRICLVPLDNVDIKDVKLSIDELKKFYKCDIILLPKDTLPNNLKVKGSGKYSAKKILSYLKSKYGKNSGKILGLTNNEISVDERILNGITYKNWSVLGLGSLGGKTCVISTKRMGVNKKDRLSKVTIHEIGHTLSLDHCTKDPHCLMNDANGTAKTIDKEKKIMCNFCMKNMKW